MSYNISIIAISAIFAISAILVTSNAHADLQTSWPWDLDSSCLDGSCNVPADLPAGTGIPDLREAVPQQIGLQNTNHNSYLRVSTAIANTGTGQWQMSAVRPATPTEPQFAIQQLLKSDGSLAFQAIVSQFEYHPAHKHFQIAAV